MCHIQTPVENYTLLKRRLLPCKITQVALQSTKRRCVGITFWLSEQMGNEMICKATPARGYLSKEREVADLALRVRYA